jgi:hypothetical protein
LFVRNSILFGVYKLITKTGALPTNLNQIQRQITRTTHTTTGVVVIKKNDNNFFLNGYYVYYNEMIIKQISVKE